MNYEKIKDAIEKSLDFELTNEKMDSVMKSIQKENEANIFLGVHGECGDESAFLEACKPLMKYLCENYHPHVTVIIDGSRAELVEGLKTAKCDDYIRD